MRIKVSHDEAKNCIAHLLQDGHKLLGAIRDEYRKLDSCSEFRADRDIPKWRQQYLLWLSRAIEEIDRVFPTQRESLKIQNARPSPLGVHGVNIEYQGIVNAINARFEILDELFDLVDSYESGVAAQSASSENSSPITTKTKKVFVVHGHDGQAKAEVAAVLLKLDLKPIILHEQPDQGQTVIEKFEANSDVAFAVVLLTPDDVGIDMSSLPSWPLSGKENMVAAAGRLQERARQNVVLELGYFLGKLGRNKVCALKKGNIEIPTDYGGVIWKSMDDSGWRAELAREMKAAGLDVDMNKL